jgi:hypothetical protein
LSKVKAQIEVGFNATKVSKDDPNNKYDVVREVKTGAESNDWHSGSDALSVDKDLADNACFDDGDIDDIMSSLGFDDNKQTVIAAPIRNQENFGPNGALGVMPINKEIGRNNSTRSHTIKRYFSEHQCC